MPWGKFATVATAPIVSANAMVAPPCSTAGRVHKSSRTLSSPTTRSGATLTIVTPISAAKGRGSRGSRRMRSSGMASAHHRLCDSAASMTQKVMQKPFGARLKWWREHRGHSQLALSGAAEISQRHLSVMFFGIFFVFYNIAMSFTTAARGALALSTLPLWTMAIAALLGAEPLTARKALGVVIAVGGVGIALLAGLASAPEGAWRGDLIMVAATVCMAFYNVWSRPFIARSSPLGFVTASMSAGAICLVAVAAARGSVAVTQVFSSAQ